jgi:lysophospholipase L1-like esterase
MQALVKSILIGVLLLMLHSCNKEEHLESPVENYSTNKILPLGASRVEGARPVFESYRYQLWKELIRNNWTFDFIGTQSDNAFYPRYNNQEFDNDHEGRGGITSDKIIAGLHDWLNQTGSPDIVLFSSPGGNDILIGQEYNLVIFNINIIIDILQADNPNVTILIEQPAEGRSDFMTKAYTSAFNQLQEDILVIAKKQTTATSKVIAVDMFTGFKDNYLYDEVHYNKSGAGFIANRYYQELKKILKE